MTTTSFAPEPTIRRRLPPIAAAAITIGVLASTAVAAYAQPAQAGGPSGIATLDGTLADGATWTIRTPERWNGTLVLYAHGMVIPGDDNPAVDSPEPLVGRYLLDHGYAIAGSSYAGTGFVPTAAVKDQADVVEIFRDEIGTPTTTVAWGTSLGGAVTASLLEQRPDLFDGGLSMCGVLAGGVGLMDSYLDAQFVLAALLAPEANIPLVDLSDPFASSRQLEAALNQAQATPAGRARIALAAAVADVPGWAGAGSPRPDSADVDAQQAAQFAHLTELAFFGLGLRADIEGRVGGNPSTNAGVDYAALLRRSNAADEVAELYRQAGADLRVDLRALAKADRIAADPDARRVLGETSTFSGNVDDPMLTLHTAGDQLAVVEQESAYRSTVRHSSNGPLLRQAFTERAGHCTFTPGEMLAALFALTDRIESGKWRQSIHASALNDRAIALGPEVNVHTEDDPDVFFPTEPAFTDLDPGRFPRPFDRN